MLEPGLHTPSLQEAYTQIHLAIHHHLHILQVLTHPIDDRESWEADPQHILLLATLVNHSLVHLLRMLVHLLRTPARPLLTLVHLRLMLAVVAVAGQFTRAAIS